MIGSFSLPPLLTSLGVGVALIAVANIVARHWLGPSRGAFSVFALTLFLYVPYAVLRWPGGDVFAIHLALYLVVSLGFGIVASGDGRGPPVPKLFLAGLLAFASLVVVVNLLMVTVSDLGVSGSLARLVLPEPRGGGSVSSRFPGTVTPDVGHREALYQDHLRQITEQTELGWQLRKGWLGAPRAGRVSAFQLAVAASDGSPLQGAIVEGTFLRPSDPGLDQAFVMTERAPGVYRSELALPVPGQWNLLLRIQHGGELYEIRGTTRVGGDSETATTTTADPGRSRG